MERLYSLSKPEEIVKQSIKNMTQMSLLGSTFCSIIFLIIFHSIFSQRLLSVDIGAHVVVKGERTGYIEYIGHLDGVGQPNNVFVGLNLDAPGTYRLHTVTYIG